MEIALVVVAIAIFAQAYYAETDSGWEMYAVMVVAGAAVVISSIGLRKRTGRAISLLSGLVGLIILAHSLTEIVMAYAFTGHLP